MIDYINEINDLRHLSFEEYFQDDWRKCFQDKETVQNILAATGLLSSHDFVQINSQYLIDDNRVAVIASIKRKNAEVLEKLIIDVIAANSTFEQFYDIVYNIGSDCDYRIIVCDWNSKNDSTGLWMTDDIMCQLVNLFHGHLSLYWICADAIRDVDGTKRIIYTVIESVSKSCSLSDFPAKRDLEYAELSLYTVQASGYFSSSDENPLKFCNYYEGENSWAEWTDEGIITKVSLSQNEYDWLFANHADKIKEDNCSYKYDKNNQEMIITEHIPFLNFNYSLPEDKRYLAEKFYYSARIDVFLIDELIGDMEAEEPQENPQIKVDRSDEPVATKTETEKTKEEYSGKTEPVIYPSVAEFLGPKWKQYFQKDRAFKEIIRVVCEQDKFQAPFRRCLCREDRWKISDGIAYDFIELNSVTQPEANRLKMIATFLEIKSGLFEKWSVDVSPFPTLSQILDTLYDSSDECVKKIILYFMDFTGSDKTDVPIEVIVENDALERILYDASSFTDAIHPVWTMISDSIYKKNKLEVSFLQGLCSRIRGKIPSRSVFETDIWNTYYAKFVYESDLKNGNKLPDLISNYKYPYSKIPFTAWPEWTDKGLFMKLYASHDCPETNWLLKFKIDELKRRYNGRDLQIEIKPYTHYCVVIHLHESPVSDFIESSTLAKFNYMSDIRKQQLDMVRHIEEIFQDYVPEEKLS